MLIWALTRLADTLSLQFEAKGGDSEREPMLVALARRLCVRTKGAKELDRSFCTCNLPRCKKSIIDYHLWNLKRHL